MKASHALHGRNLHALRWGDGAEDFWGRWGRRVCRAFEQERRQLDDFLSYIFDYEGGQFDPFWLEHAWRRFMEPVVSFQAQALYYARQLALARWQATQFDEPSPGSHLRGQADALRDASTEIREAFWDAQARMRLTLPS